MAEEQTSAGCKVLVSHLTSTLFSHKPLTRGPSVYSMDSPLLNQLFRQLFKHRACQCSRTSSIRRLGGTRHGPSPTTVQHQQYRSFLSRRDTASKKNPSNDGTMWTKRDDYPRDLDQQLRTFPLVTAKELRSRRERPRQVKMLTREFIDGKLYSTQ